MQFALQNTQLIFSSIKVWSVISDELLFIFLQFAEMIRLYWYCIHDVMKSSDDFHKIRRWFIQKKFFDSRSAFHLSSDPCLLKLLKSYSTCQIQLKYFGNYESILFYFFDMTNYDDANMFLTWKEILSSDKIHLTKNFVHDRKISISFKKILMSENFMQDYTRILFIIFVITFTI